MCISHQNWNFCTYCKSKTTITKEQNSFNMFKIRTFVQTNLKIKHNWLNNRIWFLTNSKSSKVLLILFCSSLFPFRKCESGAVNRTRFKSRLISLESERDRPNCLSVCLPPTEGLWYGTVYLTMYRTREENLLYQICTR